MIIVHSSRPFIDDAFIFFQLKKGVNDRVANIGGFSDKTIPDGYGGSEGDPTKGAANIVHQVSHTQRI